MKDNKELERIDNKNRWTKVEELDARLRRVEERVHDDTMSGQASAQGGNKQMNKMRTGRNGAENGGCALTGRN